MKYYFFLFVFAVACNQIVQTNKPVIEATLNSHAATKSLKIKDFKVNDYQDRSDSALFFVEGHYSNDSSFNDTLRFAKKTDSLVISN